MKTRYTAVVAGAAREIVVESSDERCFRVTVGASRERLLEVRLLRDGEYAVIEEDTSVSELTVARLASGVLDVQGAVGQARIELLDEVALARAAASGGAMGGAGAGVIEAPMPGRVVKLLVGEGDAVVAGQGVVIVEAMKMENELRSSVAGVVTKVSVGEGEGVESGQKLVVIEPVDVE